MRKALVAVLLAAAVSVSLAVYYGSFEPASERGIESTVSRVIDGDTIQLANGDLVRLIGVDAPEKNQPYHAEIMEQMKKLEGKIVRMEKDRTNKDRYGRYLRYIFLEDQFVNLELIRSGLVYVYIVNPDRRFEKEFMEAEVTARTGGIGIWKKSRYSDCVSLEEFHYNAKGDDNGNLGDEFFSLRNVCEDPVEMDGWSVRNTFNTFQIPRHVLGPGKDVRIVSGIPEEPAGAVSLSLEKPIWNNNGDTLYLKDELGSIVLTRSYKNAWD